MDLAMFGNKTTGRLQEISDTDPRTGPWTHQAFCPDPLPDGAPDLSPASYLAVANARASIAVLDSTARRLPNPTLLRTPTLRREAQATSALEGTYAPLSDVLTADEEAPPNADLREILNYVRMANHAFDSVAEGRPLSVGLLEDLQRVLVQGTSADNEVAGTVRTIQVVIGRRPGVSSGELPVRAARFVPPPPGAGLLRDVRDLVGWMRTDRDSVIDPVVACAMAHQHFETLHPFNDGNGRIGRLLVVLHLHSLGVLEEPTLAISPWFEARRAEYYDRLLGVSTHGAWDEYVEFFATGLKESADLTHRQMLSLLQVQEELQEVVRRSTLRAETARLLVDFAVANPSFTIRRVESALHISRGRANALVNQLVDLGVLHPLDDRAYDRRFYAPQVLEVLLRAE